MKKLIILAWSSLALLGSVSDNKAQIAIQADITDGAVENPAYSWLLTSTGSRIPVGASLDFFWFNSTAGSSDLLAIQSMTSATSWTGSSLYSRTLNTLLVGAGYSVFGADAAGLFAGQIDVVLPTSPVTAVGKSLGLAVTYGTELGIFKFDGTLPANGSAENPVQFGALLANVNSSGVLVGNFVSNTGPYDFGDGIILSGEGYQLVPEPSTGALIMIGAAGLVALRRLRKA